MGVNIPKTLSLLHEVTRGDFLLRKYSAPPWSERFGSTPEQAQRTIMDMLTEIEKLGVSRYADWLLSRFAKADALAPGLMRRWREDIGTIAEHLKLFYRYRKRIVAAGGPSDVNKIEHLAFLWQITKPYKDESDLEALGQGTAQKIHEDSKWLLVVPKDEAAACRYGAGTRWCTAARKDNRFHEYSSRGPLYVIIDKSSGEKAQFHFASGQYMDESDSPLDLAEYFSHCPLKAKLIQAGLGDLPPPMGWRDSAPAWPYFLAFDPDAAAAAVDVYGLDGVTPVAGRHILASFNLAMTGAVVTSGPAPGYNGPVQVPAYSLEREGNRIVMTLPPSLVQSWWEAALDALEGAEEGGPFSDYRGSSDEDRMAADLAFLKRAGPRIVPRLQSYLRDYFSDDPWFDLEVENPTAFYQLISDTSGGSMSGMPALGIMDDAYDEARSKARENEAWTVAQDKANDAIASEFPGGWVESGRGKEWTASFRLDSSGTPQYGNSDEEAPEHTWEGTMLFDPGTFIGNRNGDIDPIESYPRVSDDYVDRWLDRALTEAGY